MKPRVVWPLLTSPYTLSFSPKQPCQAHLLSFVQAVPSTLPRWPEIGQEGTGGPFPLLYIQVSRPEIQALELRAGAQGRESHKQGSFQLLLLCSSYHTRAHIQMLSATEFQLGPEEGMYIEAHNSQKNNTAWPHSQGQASPVLSRPLTDRPAQPLCCSPRTTLWRQGVHWQDSEGRG